MQASLSAWPWLGFEWAVSGVMLVGRIRAIRASVSLKQEKSLVYCAHVPELNYFTVVLVKGFRAKEKIGMFQFSL